MKNFVIKTPLLLLILAILSYSVNVNGQGSVKKETQTAREKSEDAKLKKEIEKELEIQELQEEEHQQMHKKDDTKVKKLNGNNNQNKGNMQYGTANALQQVRSENAKETLMNAHQNMEQANAILIRTEEKISLAREKLADPEYRKRFSPEQLEKKEENLEKAVKALKKAQENYKIYNAKVDRKLSKIQNKQLNQK